jgi:hypothetical protein
MDDVQRFLSDEFGLAVVSTTSSAGRVLSSVVNCGVMAHPVSGETVVALVSGGAAMRNRHIRRGSEVTVVARRGWRWAGVTGPAALIGPDDPTEGFDDDGVRLLLREVFRAAGGTHDDWDEYDRVMLDDRRAAVFISPTRLLGNAG